MWGNTVLFLALDNGAPSLRFPPLLLFSPLLLPLCASLSSGMWDNTVLFLVSDNGAQLDHGYNAPHRGGKHTFFEGGVRVVGFLSSPLLPPARRGTLWSGLAHSSDWCVGSSEDGVDPLPSLLASLPLFSFLLSSIPSSFLFSCSSLRVVRQSSEDGGR